MKKWIKIADKITEFGEGQGTFIDDVVGKCYVMNFNNNAIWGFPDGTKKRIKDLTKDEREEIQEKYAKDYKIVVNFECEYSASDWQMILDGYAKF